MPIDVNNSSIKYACHKLGVKGTPNFMRSDMKAEIFKILKKCDSYLELQAFVGACYYIQGRNFERPCTVHYFPVRYSDIGEAIVVMNSETWMESGFGYYSLMIVPQFVSVKNHNYVQGRTIELTHDFALFVPRTITQPRERHQILCAVEVDGEAVHSPRRDKDALRDRNIGYPVLRLREESEDMREWFRYLDPGSAECRVPVTETTYRSVI